MKRRLLTLPVLVALAIPSGAAGNEPGDETASVGGGVVAIGGFDGAGDDHFSVMFVIPDSTAIAPGAAGVSFDRPWAWVEKRAVGIPALGTSEPCAVLTNPTSWSAGYAVHPPTWNGVQPKPLSGVYLDVGCEGSEFDYYRIRFDDQISGTTGQPQNTYDTRTHSPEVHYWGSALQQFGGTHGTLTMRAEYEENADVSVCGFNGSRFECLDSAGGAGGQISFASLIAVTRD